MSEHVSILLYIKNMLADLIYINGIIATEIIKITENTATIRDSEELLQKSKRSTEHLDLNKKVIDIVRRYQKKPEDTASLASHVLKHLE
jgi:hypothetical protein